MTMPEQRNHLIELMKETDYTKTFEQCCDEVAKKQKSYWTWNVLLQLYYGGKIQEEKMIKFEQEAAELYAREKVKEAVEMAKEGSYKGSYKGPSTYSIWTFDYTLEEILEKLGL